MDYFLFDLVFESADAMMRKLYKKHLEGYRDWDKPTIEMQNNLIHSLQTNLNKGDYVDVMIISAMLNYRKFHKISAKTRNHNP